jgi:O-acetylhomoserine (thiol)-lyase
VAFEAETAEELEASFRGQKQRHLYSRITNPTVEYYQAKVQAMTGAFRVLALSSGMAAVSNLLMALGRSGDNFITSRHLFGNTLSLFEKTLKPFRLEARFTDLTDPDKVRGLVDSNTIAIFLETITNPQLEVADIRALAEVAGDNGLVLITDTTMTPPGKVRCKKNGGAF